MMLNSLSKTHGCAIDASADSLAAMGVSSPTAPHGNPEYEASRPGGAVQPTKKMSHSTRRTLRFSAFAASLPESPRERKIL